MKNDLKNFQKVFSLSRHARLLEGIYSLLSWDQETYMPPKATAIRAEQLSTMAGLIHKEKTSPNFAEALNKLIDLKNGRIKAKSLPEQQKTSLKEWRKLYLRDTALPQDFVEEFSKLTSNAIEAWKSAREGNSFQRFAPFLDRIIAMNRKKADYLGYKDHPYDALLSLYEDDITTQEVSILFSKLQKEITELLKKITAKKQVEDKFLFGKFDAEKQLQFSKKILEAMGCDMEAGRLDLSVHPFSSAAHPTDSRITTKIHPTSLMSCIFAVLHEAGHSLYEMGLKSDLYGSPLGEPISMAVHESQSRWWETRIGQSKSFWKHFLPVLHAAFPKLKKVNLEQFYKAINKVQPGFIRIEADEVTYSLHIILRFELEKDLIAGTLKVRDLPEAWNAKMKHYLGIVPKTVSEGCLQDIHWSMGAFGYFPSYTIGNLYAAQLFNAFEKKHPKWESQVEKGKLVFITEWLKDQIHQHGKSFTGPQLIEKVTGKTFSEKPFIDYLKTKYSKIY
jgi:carboxypeptidase Taq